VLGNAGRRSVLVRARRLRVRPRSVLTCHCSLAAPTAFACFISSNLFAKFKKRFLQKFCFAVPLSVHRNFILERCFCLMTRNLSIFTLSPCQLTQWHLILISCIEKGSAVCRTIFYSVMLHHSDKHYTNKLIGTERATCLLLAKQGMPILSNSQRSRTFWLMVTSYILVGAICILLKFI